MDYIIVLFIILIILYYAWEIILMSLLLYGIATVAKTIYKSEQTHAVLGMYLWIVYGGALFLLLCLPITHVRWFNGEKTWLEKLYNTEYLSKIESDRNKYITYLLDNNLYKCKMYPSSEQYQLYNRIASKDAENLYLSFHVGMHANEVYDLNKNEDDKAYYPYSYSQEKKYELIDNVDFELDGIFLRKRLQGIVLREVDASSLEGRTKAEILSKTIRKKYGDPVEITKDSSNYIAKWLFNDKHIIVASIQDPKRHYDSYYSYHSDINRFTGIIIYNPHSIIPLIEQKIGYRIEREKAAKEQKKREIEQERKAILQKQEELKAARQKEIADSISAAKKKSVIQNGF